MKPSFIVAALALAALGTGAASAATITFTVQNQNTTTTINNTYLNTCGTISPALGPISPSTTSPTHSANCGTTTAFVFDYLGGSRKCRFNVSSVYTPPNPLLGTSAYWTPSVGATPTGTGTVCRAVITSIAGLGAGNFTVAFSMQ